MSNSRKLNAQDLLNSESEILKRIAAEVMDSEHPDVVSGHYSGHKQSAGHHTQHNSAMREKIKSKEQK